MSTSHEALPMNSQCILSELTCPLHFSVSLDMTWFMWCSCSKPHLSIICGQVRSNKLGLAHSLITFVALITRVHLGPSSLLQPERVPCIAGPCTVLLTSHNVTCWAEAFLMFLSNSYRHSKLESCMMILGFTSSWSKHNFVPFFSWLYFLESLLSLFYMTDDLCLC